ncbi:MAG TPA: asparagine--tRNA ligase [Bacteriovoracaceae bacterium]|nr:asparagine--tRNA ligase [Bacteriovoracaceae bacterium]
MSEYLLIKKVFEVKPVDQTITVKGWIKSLRQAKKFSFMVLNDGTTIKDLQIIVDMSLPNYEEVSKLTMGSSVEIQGLVVASNGKQPIEMQAKSVHIYCANSEDYPLQKKETSLEYLREIAHLRSRTNTFSAVFRLRHVLAQATHEFFSNDSFTYLHTPIITASDAEGAGEMFRISTLPLDKLPRTDKGQIDFKQDYFGRETFLSVSGQLEAETFAVGGLGRVYTFGPTFRSENSNTARHLSEFWMVEPEASFFTLEDNAKLATNYVKHLIRRSLDQCGEELEFLSTRYAPDNLKTLEHVMNSPFEMVTYTKAIEILTEVSKTHKFDFPVTWGMDLQTEHERFLAEQYFKRPTIVTDYPKDIKAFYMKQNDDGKTVRAMDVLVPGVGELIGGSQREDNLEKLVKRMEEMKMDTKTYWWYLDLRKYGSVPHAGFGLGFERAVMYISGMTNIRDVIPFPRTPKNAEF